MSNECNAAQVIVKEKYPGQHVYHVHEGSSNPLTQNTSIASPCEQDIQSQLRSLRNQYLKILEQNLEERKNREKIYQDQIAKLRAQYEKQIAYLREIRDLNLKGAQKRDNILQDMQAQLKQSLATVAITLSQQQQTTEIACLKAKLLERHQEIQALKGQLQAQSHLTELKDQQIVRVRAQLETKQKQVTQCMNKLKEASEQAVRERKKHQSQLKDLKVVQRGERKNLQFQWQSKITELMKEKQLQLKKKDQVIAQRMQSEKQILDSRDKIESELFNLKQRQKNYQSLIKENNQNKQELSKIRTQHQHELIQTQLKLKAELKLIINQHIAQAQISKQSAIQSFRKKFQEDLKKLRNNYEQSSKNLTATLNKELEIKDKIIKRLEGEKSGLQAKIKKQKEVFDQKEDTLKKEIQRIQEKKNGYAEEERNIRKYIKEQYGSLSSPDPNTITTIVRNLLEQARLQTTAHKQQYQQEHQRVRQLAAYTQQIKNNIQDAIQFQGSNLKTNICRVVDDSYHLGAKINQLTQAFSAKIGSHKAQLLTKENIIQTIKDELVVTRDELKAQRQKHTETLKRTGDIEAQKLKKQYELTKFSKQYRSQRQEWLKDLKQRDDLITKLQEQIKKLNQTISSLETQLNNSLQQKQDIQKLNRQIEIQLDRYRVQNKKLKSSLLAKDSLTSGLSEQSSQKERILKDQFDRYIQQTLNKLSSTLEKTFGDKPSNLTFETINQYILTKTPTLPQNPVSTAFSVSEILERMPKERQFLQSQCCEFLKCRDVSSKLSFKYDDNCKNFGFYIPTATRKFAFLVLFRAKKTQTVFGVVSSSIGRDSTSMAVNLTAMKIMKKSGSSRAMPSSFENNILKFGNEEISIKNTWGLDLNVNTGIIGERYFSFTREEFVGHGEVSPVALQAMEIHRIYTL